MAYFHKIKKHYVSSIDNFIAKIFGNNLTASQQANLDKHKNIAQMRDNKIKPKTKSSIWDNF
jgi:hypothetical protein